MGCLCVIGETESSESKATSEYDDRKIWRICGVFVCGCVDVFVCSCLCEFVFACVFELKLMSDM